MKLSNKANQISPSLTLDITAKAKELKNKGFDVISFGAGEPDFDTPNHIKNAAINAINSGFTKYTPTSGIIDLKEAVCYKFKTDNKLNYTPDQILISNGAKHSLYNAFLAILEKGDEVIVPIPYWVSYPEMIKLAGGVPIYTYLMEENNFKLDLNDLESKISDKTKAIILNFPNNPTGCVISEEDLIALGEIILKYNLYVISDEIYEKIIYDGNRHFSIASLNEKVKDHTILINGVSKTYSMTGWRIGYAAANSKVIKAMSNIQGHTTSGSNSIAQKAAVAALMGSQEEVDFMVKEFARRRDYMVNEINTIQGIKCGKPAGAFYVFANISHLYGNNINGRDITDSLGFSKALLEQGEVAVIPGSAFGLDSYIRLSYATSMENIIKGLEKLKAFVDYLNVN
ncbi:MAG TPA: pyridoxal phosphate-dependent aminotransferase [Thermoanaerobacterales bacterium]|nr:pyridoxal phosphate-dependent aminotransferase [Thermoanaerobacterales bacterium]